MDYPALINRLHASVSELIARLGEDFADAGQQDAGKTNKERLLQIEEYQSQLEEGLSVVIQRLRETQAVANIGSWETDLESMSVIWSEQAHNIFGTDLATFSPTHQHFLKLVHEEDRVGVNAALLQSLNDSAIHTIEHRLQPQDGEIKIIEERWQVVQSEDGSPKRAIGTCRDITAQRAVENALRASEELFAAAFFHASIGMALLKPDGSFVRVNPTFCAMLGYKEEEFLNLTFQKITHPEDLATDLSLVEKLVAGEVDAYQLEKRYHHHAGHVVWVLLNASVVRDDLGQPVYLIAQVQDITERKFSEQALRTSEEEFRTLAEAAPQIVWVTDQTGSNIYLNQRWTDYTGLSREESSSHKWIQRFHPDDRQRSEEAWHTALQTGGGYAIECRIRSREGDYRWWLVRGVPLIDEQGEIQKWIGTCTDIDELKQAQHKLNEQAALLDKAQDAILVRDLEHRITYWNRSAETLYGWSESEVVGRSVREILYNDPREFDEAMAQLLTEGEWSGEIEYNRRDGKKITVVGRWTLLKNERDEPSAVLAINTDITARKVMEKQFLQAQRMESLGTLAGGIAHDLNNSLAPIILALDLLEMAFPDAKSQELLATVRLSAQRGADMVQQVLSFARGVEGRRMEMSVVTLLGDIEKIANETFLKHIHVVSSVPPDLWPVMGDSTQLHQVLLNLCVNARDAMPHGGQLALSAENCSLPENSPLLQPGSKAGSYVCITIRDTGAGIAPDIKEKIFDPFFTTKDIGKGTGLGLSTSLGIVKSHGGFIRIESTVGRGTEFAVYLPARLPIEPAPDLTASEPPPLPPGQGELILVVDDEFTVREITRQTLEAFGYRVLVAADGAQAAAIYATRIKEVAVVLTDMMMPMMDGPTTIRALKTIHPEVCIIGASGLVSDNYTENARKLGIKYFLPKPYTTSTLLKTLQLALAEKRASQVG